MHLSVLVLLKQDTSTVCSFCLANVLIIIVELFPLVNLDDCWQVSRDSQGTIQPDPVQFPNGIASLADYIHSKNLKFGLYSGFTSLCLQFSFFLSMS